jgi:hypothetical protein
MLEGANCRNAPSSNLGSDICKQQSMIRVPIDDDRTFNNPDGFAMVFDRTWKHLAKVEQFADLSIDQRIDEVIEKMEDHPFLQAEPEQARQIAIFRVRLLNLDGASHSS